MNLADRRDAGRAEQRVAAKGMAVRELDVLGVLAPECRRHVIAEGNRGQRAVARAHALAHAHDVRQHAEGLRGEHLAGAAEAGDDLVEDQQHVVAVADLAQARQILGRRRGDAAGVADRLDDHRGDGLRPLQLDDPLDLVDAGDAAARVAQVERAGMAGGRHGLEEARQRRLENRLAARQAGGRERAHRGAVVAGVQADDLVLERIAGLAVVLPGRPDTASKCLGSFSCTTYSPGCDDLSAFLLYRSKWNKVAGYMDSQLFLKFTDGSLQNVLAFEIFSLGY